MLVLGFEGHDVIGIDHGLVTLVLVNNTGLGERCTKYRSRCRNERREIIFSVT